MSEAMQFSEWVDKLCGVMVKMNFLNHKKLEERAKKRPDLKKLDEIQRQVDSLNELRYEYWNQIEMSIKKIMEGKYQPRLKEVRTYDH